ncbi:hypothetical protein HAX54_045517 [Datura stramonium]|uniref:Uncharacterized protein n=1 Tax=Datura stramonium TaxID=4076 RepID=A0ABS8WHW7_DATST|nr:hypothetical protein [Datura stramonium]
MTLVEKLGQTSYKSVYEEIRNNVVVLAKYAVIGDNAHAQANAHPAISVKVGGVTLASGLLEKGESRGVCEVGAGVVSAGEKRGVHRRRDLFGSFLVVRGGRWRGKWCVSSGVSSEKGGEKGKRRERTDLDVFQPMMFENNGERRRSSWRRRREWGDCLPARVHGEEEESGTTVFRPQWPKKMVKW